MTGARDILKSLTPPLVVRALRGKPSEGLRFVGHPSGWADAMRQSSGYSDASILERVASATRTVVAGRAAYERDSVLFHEPAIPFHLVAGILRSAAMDGGRVRVIDIGGSLGSLYRQCRPFLSSLEELEWHIVEQATFVVAGRKEFSTSELQFHNTVDEVPPGGAPVTFLMSSVLQYLERPEDMLRSLIETPSRHLLIDRTPLSAESTDRLCIQYAPKTVYDASYPSWIFSRVRLEQRLSAHWAVVSDHLGSDGRHRTADGLPFEYRSLILERRQ